MELCTAGSLFSMLDDPEYLYGLPENEFKRVLLHISKTFWLFFVVHTSRHQAYNDGQG